MQKLILSIDAGASSTKYAVLDFEKKLVLKDYSTDSMYFSFDNTNNLKTELTNILASVKSDFPDLYRIFAGISGLDSGEDMCKFNSETKEIFEKYYPKTKLNIFNDTDFLLMFSASPNKVGIISGTGSNCVGVNKKGVMAKCGGLGAILANQGSGYYIGLLALKKALKSADGRGIKTILEQAILDKYNTSDFGKVKEMVQTTQNYQKEIAGMSKLVAICAQNQDKVAVKILDKTIFELFLHIKSIEKALFPNETFEIVAAGNIFQIDYVKKGFEAHVVKCFGPKINIIFLNTPHYLGPVNIKSD